VELLAVLLIKFAETEFVQAVALEDNLRAEENAVDLTKFAIMEYVLVQINVETDVAFQINFAMPTIVAFSDVQVLDNVEENAVKLTKDVIMEFVLLAQLEQQLVEPIAAKLEKLASTALAVAKLLVELLAVLQMNNASMEFVQPVVHQVNQVVEMTPAVPLIKFVQEIPVKIAHLLKPLVSVNAADLMKFVPEDLALALQINNVETTVVTPIKCVLPMELV